MNNKNTYKERRKNYCMYTNESLVEAAATMPQWLSIKSPRDPVVLEALRRVNRANFLDGRLETFGLGNPDIMNTITDTRAAVIKEIKEKQSEQTGKDQQENNSDTVEIEQKVYDLLTECAWRLGENILFAEIPNKYLAYNDTAILIGDGQTCSQPSLVALMDDLLELKPGYNVLEIGSGCGYHAALTAELIGEKGRLTTIEINPNLAKMTRSNLEKHFKGRAKKIEFVVGDGSIGYLPNSPYDRIYLTAAPKNPTFNPQILIDQLNKDNGILLFPTEYDHNLNLIRFSNGKEERKSFYGVSFVDLKGDNS